MKVIFTYKKIKGSPKYSNSIRYTINHAYNETTNKAECGFDWKESLNIIGRPLEESDLNMITCKKCRKKLGLD